MGSVNPAGFIYAAAGVVVCLLLGVALALALRLWVRWRVRSRVYRLEQEIPHAPMAIVLGAGLWRDGSPTPVLYDRVATGADLYQRGIVKRLLLSGDDDGQGHNEPAAMQKLALQLGVRPDALLLDPAGRRTYDSMYRAKHLHHVEQAVIITQRFHLDRALYLANALGIDAVGVVADRRRYRRLALQRSRVREVLAAVSAWLDIHLLHPHPTLEDADRVESRDTGGQKESLS